MLGALCGCEGDSSGASGSDKAYLDVHGTVGTYTLDLVDQEVTYGPSGPDDSLTSFESTADDSSV